MAGLAPAPPRGGRVARHILSRRSWKVRDRPPALRGRCRLLDVPSGGPHLLLGGHSGTSLRWCVDRFAGTHHARVVRLSVSVPRLRARDDLPTRARHAAGLVVPRRVSRLSGPGTPIAW